MTQFGFSDGTRTAEPMPSDWQGLKGRIHQRFVAESDVAVVSRLPREALTGRVRDLAATMLAEEDGLPIGRQRDALVEAVVSEIAGLGPLDALLADPDVTEVSALKCTDRS